jgi:hypothetical protein
MSFYPVFGVDGDNYTFLAVPPAEWHLELPAAEHDVHTAE